MQAKAFLVRGSLKKKVVKHHNQHYLHPILQDQVSYTL